MIPLVLLLLSACDPEAVIGTGDQGFTDPPGIPDGLTASDGLYIGYVRLGWNTVAEADHYKIYYSYTSTGPYSAFDTC